MQITQKLVNDATGMRSFDLMNQTLLNLCKDFPDHKEDDVIIAKIWLIGRSYAAALERGRKDAESLLGDKFYLDVVAPSIRKSKIDDWFLSLKQMETVDESNLHEILFIHFKVTQLFKDISGLEKRSLASKYLHFHFPNLFFIYDSFASKALNKICAPSDRIKKINIESDRAYKIFCGKCLNLRNIINQEYQQNLNTRQLDNLLLNIASRS